MASSSSLAASPSQGTYAYDVFLSFRGFDTREGLTRHLFETLKHHGVNTFMDNEGLGKGERIDKLFEYIDASEIFVVIFSENYGNSTWCLREISRIVNSGRLLIPVFVNVDPSNIRKQDGAFGAAFNEKILHDQKPEDIQNWREALNHAGNLSGYVLETQGNEAGVIELIAKDVVRRVKKPLDVATHPVSIDSRVKEVLRLLQKGKEQKISILMIAGIGGLGKSTLARGLHNKMMRNFDACCFLMNVRQTTLENGLMYLQQKLIRGIQNLDQDPSLSDLDDGKLKIRRAVTAKKVLLILDDVDDKDQLEALAAKSWFNKGSIVVITSRNKSIAVQHYQSDDCLLYEPQGLDDEHSLHLFSLHAFLADKPPPKFEEISMDIVRVAHGLPLALTIYGSHLFVRKDMEYWREFLDQLKKIPHDKIVESLKLTYDNLKHNEKRVFLDIAKFYMGENTEYPMYFWEACGLYPKMVVQTLVERSLIRLDTKDCGLDGSDPKDILQILNERTRISRLEKEDDIKDVHYFWMHDHLRDMANYIISQESRSGATPTIITTEEEWTNLFGSNIEQREEETKHIEGIICPDVSMFSTINNRTLDAMPNLQLLRIKGVEWRRDWSPGLIWCLWAFGCCILLHLLLIGVHEQDDDDDDDHSRIYDTPSFPTGLKWLEWRYGMFGMFPWEDLNLTHLTILDLSGNSHMRGIRSDSNKRSKGEPSLNLHGLPQLRVLNLSFCSKLKELPDLRRCPKLVKLDISSCSSLRNIDGSNIVHLHSLTHFYLKFCNSLETLPPLPESLVKLVPFGCSSLTTISDLSNLVNLEFLNFKSCWELTSFPGLEELRLLRGKELRCKMVPEDILPEDILQNGARRHTFANLISSLRSMN